MYIIVSGRFRVLKSIQDQQSEKKNANLSVSTRLQKKYSEVTSEERVTTLQSPPPLQVSVLGRGMSFGEEEILRDHEER